MSTGSPSRPERQARFLLRAFPWRVAAERGDEIVATTLETLPAGASHLPVGTAVDLVRGGRRVRRQNRPPLPVRLAYRSGARLHPRWLRWVQDDVDDPRYLRRVRRNQVLSTLLVMTALVTIGGMDPPLVPFVVLVLAGTAFSVRRSQLERVRARARARHGLVSGGLDPTFVWVRERRRPLVPDLPAAALLAGTGTATAVLGLAAVVVVDQPHRIAMSSPELTLRAAMAPDDAVAAVAPWILGAVVAALLVAVALAVSAWIRRDRPSPEPVDDPLVRVPSVPVVVALTGLLALVAGLVLGLLWLTWWPWHVAVVLAVVGGVGAVAVVAGGVLAVIGRVRHRPVGVWEVLPRVGPREAERVLPAWWLASQADDDRWVVVAPGRPA